MTKFYAMDRVSGMFLKIVEGLTLDIEEATTYPRDFDWPNTIMVDERITRCFAFVWLAAENYDTVEVAIPCDAHPGEPKKRVRYVKLPTAPHKSEYLGPCLGNQWTAFTLLAPGELQRIAYCEATNLRHRNHGRPLS